MILYNNIQILNAQPTEIAICKQAIDALKVANYSLYEVMLTINMHMFHHDEQLVYTTCLAEHNGETQRLPYDVTAAVSIEGIQLVDMRNSAIRSEDFMGRILIENKLRKLNIKF